MRKILLSTIFLWQLAITAYGQDESLLKNTTGADSFDSLINYRDLSFRVYTVFKYQTLQLSEKTSNSRFRYVPTNPFGIGIGLSNKYIILDLGINVRFNKTNQTNRMDFQGTLYMKKQFVDFLVQSYDGYQLAGSDAEFREDIKSDVYNINYVKNLSSSEFSIKSQLDAKNLRPISAGAWYAGGYFMHSRLQADSSIVPADAGINAMDVMSITKRYSSVLGFTMGYAHSFKLPSNLFAFIGAFPGLGVQYTDVLADDIWYVPNIVPTGKFIIRSALGRTIGKNYVILSLHSDTFFSTLTDKSWWLNNTGKIKLVYGFNMKKKNKG